MPNVRQAVQRCLYSGNLPAMFVIRRSFALIWCGIALNNFKTILRHWPTVISFNLNRFIYKRKCFICSRSMVVFGFLFVVNQFENNFGVLKFYLSIIFSSLLSLLAILSLLALSFWLVPSLLSLGRLDKMLSVIRNFKP